MMGEESRGCKRALDSGRHGTKYEAMARCAVFGMDCFVRSKTCPLENVLCFWKVRGIGENRAIKRH